MSLTGGGNTTLMQIINLINAKCILKIVIIIATCNGLLYIYIFKTFRYQNDQNSYLSHAHCWIHAVHDNINILTCNV